MQKIVLATALVGVGALAPMLAHAQNSGDGTAGVQELVVTATRLPEPLALTPGAYVITQDEIQRRASPFIADVLATVPGASISTDGSFGGPTSMTLRGAAADKTLVVIDGVPVNDPTAPAGGFDFSGH